MADDNRNQNQSGMPDQGSNKDQGQQQDSNFDNPQEGRAWDNYQSRTLSSNSSESEMSSSENKGQSEDQNQSGSNNS